MFSCPENGDEIVGPRSGRIVHAYTVLVREPHGERGVIGRLPHRIAC